MIFPELFVPEIIKLLPTAADVVKKLRRERLWEGAAFDCISVGLELEGWTINWVGATRCRGDEVGERLF